jgi:bacterioferritin-associated ferredoxin
MMDLDDELCLCFHVTRRKVENFLRQRDVQRASQLSECFGAGTGCGWCRPFLHRLWERAAAKSATAPELAPDLDQVLDGDSVTAEDYAAQRRQYRDQQR